MTRGILALLVALALSPIAVGVEPEPLPLLASGEGEGWVSFAFLTDGSPMHFEFPVRYAGPTTIGVFAFDSSDELMHASTSSWDHSPRVLLFVDAPDGTEALRVEPFGPPSPGYGEWGVQVTVNEGCPGCLVGKYKLLLWEAGEGVSHEWRVRGAAGSALLGTDSGTRTFYYGLDDLSTGIVAQAGLAPASASAAIAAGAEELVEDGLFGIFYVYAAPTCDVGECVSPPPALVPSVASPDGIEMCTCFWAGGVDGRYTFSVTGAAASIAGIVLAGADARLPS